MYFTDNFTQTPQEHVVIMIRNENDRWYWDEVDPWLEENINAPWNVILSGTENQYIYTFSFADIQEAVLFKLRF